MFAAHHLPTRLRRAFRAWWNEDLHWSFRLWIWLQEFWIRQTPKGAQRIRDRALLAEVLSWLPPHYQSEVRSFGEYSDRPEVFK